MEKDIYTLINKFKCCEKIMVTVIIKNKAACIMTEVEYNRIIETERRYTRKNSLKVA